MRFTRLHPKLSTVKHTRITMLSVDAKTDSVPEPPKPKPLDIKTATRLHPEPKPHIPA